MKREKWENRRQKEQKQEKNNLSANLSIWALLAGGSFCKILLVSALMLSAECILFYRALNGGSLEGGFAEIMRKSCAYPLFLAALGLTLLILVRLEGMLDSGGRYTLMRLKVTQTNIFVIETVYNVLCLTVLFALQIGAAFWMVWLYRDAVAAKDTGGQLLLFAFYRNDFLHCLLPMAEIWKWVRNALLLLAFGMSAACGAETAKRKYVIPIALYAVTVFTFASPMGADSTGRSSQDELCGIISFWVVAATLWDVLRKFRRERQRRDENQITLQEMAES